MGRLAVFVDAGYLWVQTTVALCGNPKPRKDIAIDFLALRSQLLETAMSDFPNSDLLRVYWYDGPANSGKAQDHEQIEELDDFKLRLGTRNRTGQQKGVDGLIIADLISLTQNRAITDALLISGDADLAPGVIAAQNLGLRVHLLTLGTTQATSPFLAAEMDRKRLWSTDDIKLFAVPNGVDNPQEDEPEVEVTDPLATEEPQHTHSPVPVLEHASEAEISEIAVDFLSRCLPEKKVAMLKGVGLPRGIDIPLLKHASEKLGRMLEEEEKRSLRSHIKRMVADEMEGQD